MTLLGAMDRLTPEHRAVLTELYYRQRSVSEAADALGIPPGTVRSRSHYALRALRASFRDESPPGKRRRSAGVKEVAA